MAMQIIQKLKPHFLLDAAILYFSSAWNVSVTRMASLGFDLIIIRFTCIHTHF
jgi:hypothetical protein